MSAIEVIWTESAVNDLNTITDFISQYSISVAEQVAYRIFLEQINFLNSLKVVKLNLC